MLGKTWLPVEAVHSSCTLTADAWNGSLKLGQGGVGLQLPPERSTLCGESLMVISAQTLHSGIMIKTEWERFSTIQTKLE